MVKKVLEELCISEPIGRKAEDVLLRHIFTGNPEYGRISREIAQPLEFLENVVYLAVLPWGRING